MPRNRIHTRRQFLAGIDERGGIGDQTLPCPNGDIDCALGRVPCFGCLIDGDGGDA